MPLLLPLVDLSAFLIALGLCVVAIFFVRALFGAAGSAVGWIPWVGSKIRGDLHLIEQKLTNELGHVVAGLDHAIARTWYRLAHTIEWLGKEIAANAAALGPIAALLAALPGFADWRAFIRRVHAALTWAEQHAIGAVHTVTRPLTANVSALARWTHSQIHALRHSIAVTIPHTLAGLRHRTRAVEDAVARDWKLLKKHERLLGIGALTGAVALALSRLGLSWIRCGKMRTRGPALCNMDDGLFEALVAGTTLVFGSISIVELAKACQAITPTVEDGARFFIRELS